MPFRYPITIIVGVVEATIHGKKKLVIGKDGDQPQGRTLKDDLKFFKDTTVGNVVVVGRKTEDAIEKALGHSLCDRDTFILTRDKSYVPKERCKVLCSTHAVSIVNEISKTRDVYVIGGGQIYELFFPHVNRLLITHIDMNISDGDTFFPDIDPHDWRVKKLHCHEANGRNKYQFWIGEYTRKPRF
ncbi:MAG: dihydrofolate reductase [bacterium]